MYDITIIGAAILDILAHPVSGSDLTGRSFPAEGISMAVGGDAANEADALARHLEGMTAGEVAKLETDEDGYAADPDLLAGCTIKIDRYRDAVAEACRQAKPL